MENGKLCSMYYILFPDSILVEPTALTWQFIFSNIRKAGGVVHGKQRLQEAEATTTATPRTMPCQN